MPDQKFDLSRRKILAGLGTVGVAGAGAGAGTTALFSDEETFDQNSIQAGELNLVVDYATSVTQDGIATGSTTTSGQRDGTPVNYQYSIADLKPGDSGLLAFCPKIVDNPGYLYVSSESGISNYENGQTEPEASVDPSGGGTLGGSNDGASSGDLGQAIRADIYYASISGGSSGPDLSSFDPGSATLVQSGQTLNGLFADLEAGFLVDGQPTAGADVYPSSPDADTQNGPCLVIDWELPASVGNDVQSDAIEMSFRFDAIQSRNNATPTNPVVDITVGTGSDFDYNSLSAAVSAGGAGDVIGLKGGSTYRLSGGATLSSSLVPLDPATPTVEIDGDQLRLNNGPVVAGLDIDLLNGGVVYHPNPADGLAFINNDVSISETSGNGIRIEGAGALNAVVANNRFKQKGRPVPNQGNFPQGVLLSDGQNVVVSNNEFTAETPSGSPSAIEGIAVFVPQGPGKVGPISNLLISGNTISRWENGIAVFEQNTEIRDLSITDNSVTDSNSANTSGINTADIWLLDETGSDGFEKINGEDAQAAQETALETDNSLTSDGADVVQ